MIFIRTQGYIKTLNRKYEEKLIEKVKYDKYIAKLIEWEMNYGLEYYQSENDLF